jgi:hypothetical protein
MASQKNEMVENKVIKLRCERGRMMKDGRYRIHDREKDRKL